MLYTGPRFTSGMSSRISSIFDLLEGPSGLFVLDILPSNQYPFGGPRWQLYPLSRHQCKLSNFDTTKNDELKSWNEFLHSNAGSKALKSSNILGTIRVAWLGAAGHLSPRSEQEGPRNGSTTSEIPRGDPSIIFKPASPFLWQPTLSIDFVLHFFHLHQKLFHSIAIDGRHEPEHGLCVT
jgi:hypothetical protein